MKIKQKILILGVGILVTALVSAALVSTDPAMAKDGEASNCSVAILKGFCGKDGVWQILGLVVNILATGVGLVAVGGFIYAAILYATAEDNAAQVTKAKMTMFNITIGLVAFALMWGFLQFLIPGGVFSTGGGG